MVLMWELHYTSSRNFHNMSHQFVNEPMFFAISFCIKNSFDSCSRGFQSHFPFKYVVFKDSANQKMHNSHSLSASPRLQSTNGSQQSPISTATVSMVHSVPELMVSAEVSHVTATWETGLRPTYITFIPTSLLSIPSQVSGIPLSPPAASTHNPVKYHKHLLSQSILQWFIKYKLKSWFIWPRRWMLQCT